MQYFHNKKNVKNFVLTLIIIFNLVFLGFYPVVFAYAQEAPATNSADIIETIEKSEEENVEDNQEENTEENSQEKTEEETEETQEPVLEETISTTDNLEQLNEAVDNEETLPSLPDIPGEITTETGNVSAENPQCECPKEEDSQEGGEDAANNEEEIKTETEPPLSEECLKICQVTEIENDNDTEAQNAAVSNSDTGSNNVDNGQEDNQEDQDSKKNNEEDNEENNEKEPDNASLEENITATEEDLQNTIATGDATAVSNIVNDINKNEVGSNFSDLIINILGNEAGDINLYEKFADIIEAAGNLTAEQQTAFIEQVINNTNNAVVTNVAESSAKTGENSTEGESADSSIDTGDAVAVSNIINLINRNLVGHNWMFTMVNILGSWSGDLIVPGQGVLTVPNSSQAYEYEVINENTADVSNEINSQAQTGENVISETQSGEILSGQADSASLAGNMINTNIVKNNWFFLLVNNMGNWVGNIVNWNGSVFSGIFQYDFGTDNPLASTGGILKIKNVNNAEVDNQASAYADTGQNVISGAQEANISTGNATALARIFNFINANLVGNNWMFSIVNVMGEWNGNLEFAYPDLAVSVSDGKDTAQAGETVTFNIKVKNEGKAACQQSQIMFSLSPAMNFAGELSGERNGNDVKWQVSGFAPGEERTFTVSAKIGDLAPGKYTFTSAAGATTQTNESNVANNGSADVTKVDVSGLEEDEDDDNSDSHLSIRREVVGGGTYRPGEFIKQIFYLKNSGGTHLYGVILNDVIRDDLGRDISIYQWDIGDMPKGQEIMVDYTLQANDIGRNVSFHYAAQAVGKDQDDDTVKSREVASQITILGGFFAPKEEESAPTESTSEITEEKLSEVLGAQTGEKSVPWLWALLAIPPAYYVRRKGLYRWKNIKGILSS